MKPYLSIPAIILRITLLTYTSFRPITTVNADTELYISKWVDRLH